MPQSTPDRAYADHLAAGRAALGRYDWAAARLEFDAAVAREATGEALECLADAAWWLDDEGATFSAREAAYRAYRSAGDRHSAARMAIWLANDSLDFRGAPAVASGWMRRAHRLLDGLDDTPEYAALVAWEAHMALMLRNDAAETLRLTATAIEAARSLGLTDVEMLALVIEGLALVTAGRVREGVARVDEAATAVMAGDVDDLVIAGTILCYTMDACGRVRDYDRAQQWCDRVKRWAEEQRFPVIFAACRPHYAAVLVWRGAWAEAEKELLAARRGLEQSRPPMAVESIVRLAELRWRQGRWDEAKALFAQVEHEGLAQLGRAELALDKGDTAAASDLAQRFLRRIPENNRVERAVGLDLATRVLVAGGRIDEARAMADELRAIARDVRTGALLAEAARASALIAAAGGDHEAARTGFEDAVDLYQQCGALFEAARTRLMLAGTLRALGRDAAASGAAVMAREALAAVGATMQAQRAAALVAEIEGRAPAAASAAAYADGLTPREIELLRLLAAGRSNREIAGALVLSVRTVERHISNIYDKIGASGTVARATATAYAYSHGLASSPPS